MSGIEYKKHPVKAHITDVTGSRAIDGTIYQNTTGRPKLCIVSIICVRGDVVNAAAHASAFVEDATPPTVGVNATGLRTKSNIPEDIYGTLTFMVPNGDYYAVEPTTAGAGSTLSMGSWIEVEL